MDLILKIFYSPDEALKEIKEKKPLAIPLAVLIVINMVMTFLYIKFITIPHIDVLMEGKEMPPEAQKFMTSGTFYLVSIIGGFFSFIIATLLLAFIFYLITIVFKGKGEFLSWWSSSIHISAITVLGSIIAFPVAYLKGSPKVNLDFSLLFQFLSEKNFLRIFLEQTNFFVLWSVFLYGLALHYIGELDKKKGLYISFGLWFVYSIIMTIIGILRA